VRLKAASAVRGEVGYPSLARGLTIFAIGDIHGRADLLGALHRAIDATCRRSRGRVLEVYLGDYVDRGPHSAETVEILLRRERWRETVFLRGNHEAMLQQFLDGNLELRDWARFGGLQTLTSYGVEPSLWRMPAGCLAELRARLPPTHSTFLRTLLDWAWFGDYFFVHAGVRPGVCLEAQTAHDACWIGDEFLRDRRNHGAIVVHGHSVTPAPEFLDNRINIDTGAFLSGRLTCLRLDHEGARLFSAEGGGVLQSVATPQRSPGAKLRAAARQGGGLRFHTGRPLVGRLKAAWRSNGAPIAGVGAQGQEPALDREL